MSFEPSPRGVDLRQRVTEFLETEVLPAEAVYEEQMAASGDPHSHPQVLEDLKAEARERGLWNLFMPHVTPWTPDPVPNLDYAYLAELAGRSHLASEAMNCSAPDTGNMEVLALFGIGPAEGAVAGPAARGPDPLGVRHDRARRRLLGRHQHPALDPPGRRRLRAQRPQVVDLGRRLRAVRASSS